MLANISYKVFWKAKLLGYYKLDRALAGKYYVLPYRTGVTRLSSKVNHFKLEIGLRIEDLSATRFEAEVVLNAKGYNKKRADKLKTLLEAAE